MILDSFLMIPLELQHFYGHFEDFDSQFRWIFPIFRLVRHLYGIFKEILMISDSFSMIPLEFRDFYDHLGDFDSQFG